MTGGVFRLLSQAEEGTVRENHPRVNVPRQEPFLKASFFLSLCQTCEGERDTHLQSSPATRDARRDSPWRSAGHRAGMQSCGREPSISAPLRTTARLLRHRPPPQGDGRRTDRANPNCGRYRGHLFRSWS